MERVLGVLAGNDMPIDQIGAWARSAETILAADGGANALFSAGIQADVAIGDFDSIEREAKNFAKNILFDPDQDSSDCDKLLHLTIARRHRAITLCNVEGDQLDHVMATFQSARRAPLVVRFALRKGIAQIIKPGDTLEIPSHKGMRISLLPLEPCEAVLLEGTEWRLSGEALSPDGLSSLSNKATGDSIQVRIGTGSAVLFMGNGQSQMPVW